MTLVSPTLTLEQAQFVVNVLNEVPLPGINTKQLATGVQIALGQATPFEPEPEPDDQAVSAEVTPEPPAEPAAVVE